jgi:hypothetical protein
MIRVYLRLSAVAFSVVLAAGCAELRWHKDGASAAMTEQDLAACQQQARSRAVHDVWPSVPALPQWIGVDSLGRPIASYPYRYETDRFILEHDLARSCMWGKGYELAPTAKPVTQ